MCTKGRQSHGLALHGHASQRTTSVKTLQCDPSNANGTISTLGTRTREQGVRAAMLLGQNNLPAALFIWLNIHLTELWVHNSVHGALASVCSSEIVQRHGFVSLRLVSWGLVAPEGCLLLRFPCFCHDLNELWQLHLTCSRFAESNKSWTSAFSQCKLNAATFGVAAPRT